MKLLIGLMLWFGCVTGHAYPGSHVLDGGPFLGYQKAESRLVLQTRIDDERYTIDQGTITLRWNLTLTYTNSGAEPILLYKKSSLIYRSMVSRHLKAASRGKYLQDTSSHFISSDAFRAAGFLDRSPEEADFVTLKPGESYSVQSKYHVHRRSNSTADDGLAPGKYFIEMRVATWYFWVDPKQYREQRRGDGYVWSQNMTSEPMQFRIE